MNSQMKIEEIEKLRGDKYLAVCRALAEYFKTVNLANHGFVKVSFLVKQENGNTCIRPYQKIPEITPYMQDVYVSNLQEVDE